MRLIHSYSALKLYEQCGLRYYRQRILKDVYEQQTVHTTHGNEVHKAIEDKIKHGTPVPPELTAYSGIINVVERSAKAAGKAIAVEQNLGLDNHFNPAGYWDSNIWLRAKLDVVTHGGQEAEVIDWKTGKRKVDFTQLRIATIAVFKSYVNVNTVTSAFVWLKDQIMDKEVHQREGLPSLIDEIKPRLDSIEEAHAGNVWRPKPSYLCNYCPCKPTCPYALK